MKAAYFRSTSYHLLTDDGVMYSQPDQQLLAAYLEGVDEISKADPVAMEKWTDFFPHANDIEEVAQELGWMLLSWYDDDGQFHVNPAYSREWEQEEMAILLSSPAFYPDELMSNEEVAELFDWSKQKVNTYYYRGSKLLPPPIAILGSGPVWTHDQFEQALLPVSIPKPYHFPFYYHHQNGLDLAYVEVTVSTNQDGKPAILLTGSGVMNHFEWIIESLRGAYFSHWHIKKLDDVEWYIHLTIVSTNEGEKTNDLGYHLVTIAPRTKKEEMQKRYAGFWPVREENPTLDKLKARAKPV